MNASKNTHNKTKDLGKRQDEGGFLTAYKQKRDFKQTPEPQAKIKPKNGTKVFVVQKHWARNLHYDFRLQIKGVLKSWAVPKGPSLKENEKRLAVLTEDHPLDYAKFSGVIPQGQYGAGKVIIWDKGSFENVKTNSLDESFKQGRLEVKLRGRKLSGVYVLIRLKQSKNWLLFKTKKG